MDYREHRVCKVLQERQDRPEKRVKRVFLVCPEFRDLEASADLPESLASTVRQDRRVNRAKRANPESTGLQDCPVRMGNKVSQDSTVFLALLVQWVRWDHQDFLVHRVRPDLPDLPDLLRLSDGIRLHPAI